jgi:hypothetical protein
MSKLDDASWGVLAMVVALVIVIYTGLVWLGTWVWNVTLVPLFDVAIISHWQFFGLMILISVLAGIFKK